jgi:dynein light chain roadblock-type
VNCCGAFFVKIFEQSYSNSITDMNEAEKILDDLSKNEGVIGTIAMTKEGVPIRTTFTADETNLFCALTSHFIARTHKALEDLPEAGDLETVRIRSKKNELIIAPYGDYIFIAVQNPFIYKKQKQEEDE